MPLRRRETLVLGGIAVLAATAGFLAGPLLRPDSSDGEALFAASFSDLSGRPRQLEEWKGKILLVNFWATWCAPCREEIPMLVETYKKYKSYGVEIVGIAIDQSSKVAEYAREAKITYPVLVADATGLELLRRLGNRAGGLPYTIMVSQHGKPMQRKLGALQKPELEAMLSGITQGSVVK